MNSWAYGAEDCCDHFASDTQHYLTPEPVLPGTQSGLPGPCRDLLCKQTQNYPTSQTTFLLKPDLTINATLLA